MMRNSIQILLPLCVLCGLGGESLSPPEIRRVTFDGLEKVRPMWSPDGSRLAFARHEGGGARLWQYVQADDPKNPKRFTSRGVPDFHGAFSPDGKRFAVALVEQSGTQGNLDLAVADADGSNLKKIVGDVTGHLSHQDWPSWSPTGDRLAFSSTHDGNQEIYTCKDDGSDIVRVTQSPGQDLHPSWSPHGDWIAFATDRWGGLEIAASKPDGTGLKRLTESPGIDDFPAVSPDGKRIAFVSRRDGHPQVYVMNADGSEPRNVSQGSGRDIQPTWTPDGSAVTFASDRDGGLDFYTVAVP